MSAGITNRIKQIKEISLESVLSESKEMLPLYLITCDARLFYGISHINGYLVKTPFFTVESVDPEQQSAVLNMLVPYPNTCFHCMRALIRTETYINIDLSSMCGFSYVPLPIYDYFPVANIIQNSFCLDFKLNETEPQRTIWNSANDQLKNTATIIFHYRSGKDSFIHINIYLKEKVIPQTIPKGVARAITVPDLRKIEICSSEHLVKGTVDLLLNRKKETKIYLK